MALQYEYEYTLTMSPSPQVTVKYEVGNKIEFVKTKTEQPISEKLIVCYNVAEDIRTTTRDWIGIFRKGWTNLGERIAFEHPIWSSEIGEPLNCAFKFEDAYSAKICFSSDYHLVYVSEVGKIIAASPYFRFTVSESVATPKGAMGMDDYCPPRILLPSKESLTQSCVVSNDEVPVAQSKEEETGRCADTPNSHRSTVTNFSQKSNPEERNKNEIAGLKLELNMANKALTENKEMRAKLECKLKEYDMFVKSMFDELDIQKIIKLINNAGNEVIIRKIGEKELESYRWKHCELLSTNEVVNVVLPKNHPDTDDNIEIIESVSNSTDDSDSSSDYWLMNM